MRVKLLRHASCLCAFLLGWLWLMSGFSHSLQARQLEPSVVPDVHHQQAGLASLNWAGYIATGSIGAFKTASFQLVVPTINGFAGDHTATWVGVGGGLIASPRLVQAGIDSWIDASGHQVNSPFWEVVPGFAEQLFPLNTVIRAGDHISISVSSNNNDTFAISDLTTRVSASVVVNGSTTDGASAECIVERPFAGGAFTPLAHFNTISINGCRAGSSALGKASHHALNIVDAGGHMLASVGSLARSGNFAVTWNARV